MTSNYDSLIDSLLEDIEILVENKRMIHHEVKDVSCNKVYMSMGQGSIALPKDKDEVIEKTTKQITKLQKRAEFYETVMKQ